MSKIDWNDDIVFYAYKDNCSVFYYKGSSLLPLATESYFIPWNINTNSLKSGKIIFNKRWNEKEQKKSLQNQDWHYFAIITQESYFIFFKSPFYPWRLFSVFGIINSAMKSFPPEGMKYLKNRQSWIWPYHLGEWWKQKQ